MAKDTQKLGVRGKAPPPLVFEYFLPEIAGIAP
jgi:hypothetical protein